MRLCSLRGHSASPWRSRLCSLGTSSPSSSSPSRPSSSTSATFFSPPLQLSLLGRPQRLHQGNHLSASASFPAMSTSCSEWGVLGHLLTYLLSSCAALGYLFNPTWIYKTSAKVDCNVLANCEKNPQLVWQFGFWKMAYLTAFESANPLTKCWFSHIHDSGISLSGVGQRQKPAQSSKRERNLLSKKMK